MAATIIQWLRRLVNAYEVTASMAYLQGKNCVIHTWALQGWGSHDGGAIQIFVYLYIFTFSCQWTNQSELVGDVVVPVSVPQADLFCALRSPDVSLRLNWRRSFSTVLCQVCLGRPGRRLQFLGVGNMQACRAREWSWDFSTRATWPNNLRRLVRTVSDSSGCPVLLRTS